MPDLLPDDDPLGEPEHGSADNPTLRIFGRVLLVSAMATFILGTFTGLSNGGATDVLVPLLMLAILGIPVACFVAALVSYVRGLRAQALGFLLAGLATPLVGFGACMASLMLTNT